MSNHGGVYERALGVAQTLRAFSWRSLSSGERSIVLDPYTSGAAVSLRSTRRAGFQTSNGAVNLTNPSGSNAILQSSTGADIAEMIHVSTGARSDEPGDLLVSASTPGHARPRQATPGHAMRADEPLAGAIVGRALGTHESGRGVIEILFALQ